MADLLGPEELGVALRDLPGWEGDQTAIRRIVALATFPEAIALVNDVAKVAEDLAHHPDIDIRWRTVTFTLSTHTAGGVTDQDTGLAARIDALASGYGAGTVTQ